MIGASAAGTVVSTVGGALAGIISYDRIIDSISIIIFYCYLPLSFLSLLVTVRGRILQIPNEHLLVVVVCVSINRN